MAFLGEILVSTVLILGGVFGLVGSWGLLKLDNPMARLHAPTKASTLGVGGILAASALHAFLMEGKGSVHEILIIAFLFVTAPITANFIAKSHLHRNVDRKELPSAEPDHSWAYGDSGKEKQAETDK